MQWQDQLMQLLPEEMQARHAQSEASRCQETACCSGHSAVLDKLPEKPANRQQQRSQHAGLYTQQRMAGIMGSCQAGYAQMLAHQGNKTLRCENSMGIPVLLLWCASICAYPAWQMFTHQVSCIALYKPVE